MKKIKFNYDLEQGIWKRRDGVVVENMICHFINKQRVFLLLEQYIQKSNKIYDLIISFRFDWSFKNNFDFKLPKK